MENPNHVLQLATDCGRILLTSGAETGIVESTITDICHVYGFPDSDCFVTPTGIFISVTIADKATMSLIRRVKNRTVDLDKITHIFQVVDKLKKSKLPIEDFEVRIHQIDTHKRYSNFIQIPFAGFSAGFFCLLFDGKLIDLLVTFVIGCLIKILFIVLKKININDWFINAMAGMVAALVALLSVYFDFHTNKDAIIIGAMMLLVPGLAITNAIRDTISGDLLSGLSRATEAFLTAISIAAGSGLVLKFWSIAVKGFL